MMLIKKAPEDVHDRSAESHLGRSVRPARLIALTSAHPRYTAVRLFLGSATAIKPSRPLLPATLRN